MHFPWMREAEEVHTIWKSDQLRLLRIREKLDFFLCIRGTEYDITSSLEMRLVQCSVFIIGRWKAYLQPKYRTSDIR